MRSHDHDGPDPDAPERPRRPRDPAELPLAARALSAGHPEAATRSGLLGLQRAVGNAGVSAALEEEPSPVHDVLASSGSPLPAEVRGDMESRLGHDFSDVQVHADAPAHASAESVGATAYTVGSHVVFQRDAYDPASHAGRTVLAHELSHVVQQRHGPVDGTPAAGGIAVSDPGDRFEREAAATAERAMAAPAAVQRDVEPEEELVEEPAEPAVQRTATGTEDELLEEEPPPQP